jgi:hypothetical protein
MNRCYLFAAFAAFSLLLLAASVPYAAEGYRCDMSGAQERPTPNASPATGTGVFVLNDAETQLSYHIEYSGLLGAETASHFHTITIGTCPAEGYGGVTFGVPVGNPKDGVWNLSPANVTDLRNGCVYFNVHSDVYPGGEIRGNIYRDDSVQAEESTWGRLKVIYR